MPVSKKLIELNEGGIAESTDLFYISRQVGSDYVDRSINLDGLLNYTLGVTGAINRTILNRLSDTKSVLDFIPAGTNIETTDCTVYFQNAINYCSANSIMLIIPNGKYLITDTLNIPVGTQISGQTCFQSVKQYSQNPKATTILFQPTSAKNLFEASGTSYSNFRFYYSISNLYIIGNSVDSYGNSLYALNLDGVIYSHFENIGCEGFISTFYCNRTINNRFVNCYATGMTQAILYAGNNETTDVWEQCSIKSAPIGVKYNASSIDIRFVNCLFEDITTYGMDIAKECQNITVTDAYCENVPTDNNSSACMYRVGYSGTTAVTANHLIITGGVYQGRNAGIVGSFIDADYCNGIQISNVALARFTNGIKTSSNTTNDSIVISGFTALSITNIVTDSTKISGTYAAGVVNSAVHNRQNARLHNLTVVNNATLGNLLCGTVTPPSTSFSPVTDNTYTLGLSTQKWSNVYATAVTAASGAFSGTVSCTNITAGNNATIGTILTSNITPPLTYFAPSSDGDKNLGLLNLRWNTVYSVTGSINTSDQREKQQISSIPDNVLKAWSKVKFSQFKFNDAVKLKGEEARIHFGVIAQQVKEAFESEGIDPFAYGILCYDEWEEQPEQKDKDGNIVKPYKPAGNRYGIRYEEALTLECAYLRSKIKD